MKKMAENKSSFNKLYLIESEMFNRILPHLNEVDKQELNDLNERNRLFEDSQNDETSEQKNEESEQINISSDPTLNDGEQNIAKPPMSVVEKMPGKKIKKFACEICVDKKFTTKQSLKRHHKTFHEKKHFIKETETYPEVRYPNTSLPATERKASLIEEPESKNLKRKFEDNPEDFERDQPALKLPKYTGPIEKYREYPEIEEIEEQRGIKRKGPKRATDSMPRKRFHWESFSK